MRLTRAKLFKSYRCKSWSFKSDCSAIYPSKYNGSNWSNDNIRIRKRNKATNWKIYNSAIKRMKKTN